MLNDALSSVSGLDGSKKAKASDNSPEAIQERFMSLLVAQLKNQDPLKPMDNAAVTSQMAQLNTVTGINNLNTSMEAMTASIASQQSLQATNMLGRTVLSEGSDLSLSEGTSTGVIDMRQTADAVNVNILSSSGDVVQSINIGPLNKGKHAFNWDGTKADGGIAQNGTYKYEIVASAAGKDADAQALTQSQVLGVRNTPTGAVLLTNGGGELSLKDVKEIF